MKGKTMTICQNCGHPIPVHQTEAEHAAICDVAEMASGHEAAYVRGGEDGWVRIGRYDSARRRSLWMRLVGADEIGNVTAIELCSGREGDDAYVKLTAADPQWADICDVLLRVEGDCGLHVDAGTPPESKPGA